MQGYQITETYKTEPPKVNARYSYVRNNNYIYVASRLLELDMKYESCIQ